MATLIKTLLIVSLSIFTCKAEEVAGVQIPPSITKSDSQVNLMGAGVRDKFFIDLYVGSLYAQNIVRDAKKLIQADAPMLIRMHIISSLIGSRKMEEAVKEGFANAKEEGYTLSEAQVNEFIDVFSEAIRENDVYEFFYTPKSGTKIYKNDSLVKEIAGVDFKKALFAIWLGIKPAQESLKKAMLGLD